MGVTDISLRDFLISNFGLLPNIIINVVIGSTISSITELVSEEQGTEGGDFTQASLIFGIVFSILGCFGVVLVGRKVR
jgi:uncharacterized membrane protein YdjX (TVP38/TMEM64 family)